MFNGIIGFVRTAKLPHKVRYYGGAFRNTLHVRFALANMACGIFPDFFSGLFRARVYRMAGLEVAPGAYIMSNIELLSGLPGMMGKLKIGSGVVISSHVTINLDAPVVIEENVTLSPFVRIYTGSHDIGPETRRFQPEPVAMPVVIERGSWVALGATILPGVRIGHGSVVAAGAVVTKDVPPNCLVAGVPARVTRTFPSDTGKEAHG